MRARPDARSATRAEEVPGAVAGDLEAGLPHPAGRELVRCVFFRGVSRPVPPDRIDLVETLEDAHSGNARSTHQPASGKSARTAKPVRHDDRATSAPKSAG